MLFNLLMHICFRQYGPFCRCLDSGSLYICLRGLLMMDQIHRDGGGCEGKDLERKRTPVVFQTYIFLTHVAVTKCFVIK